MQPYAQKLLLEQIAFYNNMTRTLTIILFILAVALSAAVIIKVFRGDSKNNKK